MDNETEEKNQRNHERFRLAASVMTKQTNHHNEQTFKEFVSRDISMGGIYFIVSEWDVQPQEEVVVSISIPREKYRLFPFSRLAGKAKVVRVEQFAQQRWKGVALQFSDDLTYLSAVPL